MVLPAYLLSAGLGSKLSTWLVPPTMNSQMTFLASGREVRPAVGRRPGGLAVGPRDAVAVEHRAQDQAGEAHAQSARNASRPWQPESPRLAPVDDMSGSSHRIVTKSLWLKQHMDQALRGPAGAGSAAGATARGRAGARRA